MHLVDNPVSFPHVTLFGNGGRCVLVGELPHGGDVYLGDAEMSIAAPLLGYASPAQVDAFKHRIADLEAELAVTLTQIDRIRQHALALV